MARQLLSTSQLSFSIGLFLISIISFNKIVPSSLVASALSILTAFIAYLIFSLRRLPRSKEIHESKVAPWVFALSTLVGLFPVHHYLENSEFVLKSFAQRTIGIVTLEGIDASARSWLYMTLIILFIVVFSLSFYIYSKIDSILFRYLKKGIENERKMLFSLSLLSVFILIFHYLNGAMIIVNIFDLLIFLILLTYVVLLTKAYSKGKNELLLSLLNNYNLVVLSFLAPPVIFFIRWTLVSGSFIFNYKYFYPFILLWVTFWLVAYMVIRSFPNSKTSTAISAILSAGIPFLLIPISAPISNEVQFSLSRISNLSAHSLSVLFTFSLLGLSLFLFIQKVNSQKRPSFSSFAGNYYFPILIASMVMFNMHKNFIEIPTLIDMFHHGENLLPVQQLFSFKHIPFIDIYPTHGISYMVGQSLYSIVNGYRAFEPWLWEWLVKIFEILIFYFVLKKITNSFLAGTVIVFLPIIGIFGGQHFTYGYNTSLVATYYFAAMAPALSLAWLLKKPKFTRLVTLWLICLFLVLWRVDFGLASLAATTLIFLGIFLSKEIKGYEIPISPKQVILSLGLTTGSLFLIGLIISTLKNESFWGLLTQNLQFVKFQAQAQGLITLATTISPLVIFQYFILPAIGVFYVVFFVICIFRGQLSSFGESRWLLLFLAIFSLIMSIRSVQRQTLAVLGYNPYLFVFLGIGIPFYLKTLKKEVSITLFLLMLLGYHFILPNNTMLLKEGRLVNLYDWSNKESRVRINDYQYKDLAHFLNNNLNASQTFLDLTSSPMLYVVTNRMFINYFIPSVYHTSEPIQKFTLERLTKTYENGEIPIVIFRQSDNYANNIDGVPNEIRSYRIYEFIYKNYRPAGYINGYMIWLANNYSLPRPADLIPVKIFSQDFDLKKLPYVWGVFDEYKAKENTTVLSSLIEESKIIDPGKSVKLSLDKDIDKSSGNYIHLRILANEVGIIKLSYHENPQSKITFNLVPSKKSVDYLIRISSQWSWISQSIQFMELSPSIKIELVQAFIRKGD